MSLLSRTSLFALGALLACSSAPSGPKPPDPNQVFEEHNHPQTYLDVPYPARTTRLFRTTDVLPSLDVRALLASGDELYAGTSSAVLRYDATNQKFVPEGTAALAGISVVAMAKTTRGLVVAASDRVVVLGGAQPAVFQPAAAVTALATAGDAIWVGTSTGLYSLDATGQGTLVLPQVSPRDLSASASTVYVATSAGVARWDVQQRSLKSPITTPDLADDDVRALALSSDGSTLWAGTASGLSSIPVAGGAVTTLKAEHGGLAAADFLKLTEAGGKVLAGQAIGATALGAERDYFHSLRYLPAERVNAVAIGKDGTLWFGTPAGIGRVGTQMRTLTERAADFENFLEVRHWRMDGFVDDSTPVADIWNPDADFHHDDKDNDGLWTQMQIGPWCMAYAVTKDERYYDKARRAMDVMFLEIDVPGATFAAAGKHKGFIARSLVRDDEGAIYSEKATSDRWVRQDFNGRTYYWKNDTSSDEYAGHFFGYPLFYDLCAKTEAEKEEIRTRIRLVADYLIEGNELLIDLDGQPTTYGKWKDLSAAVDTIDGCPDRFPLEICISSWGGGGWLNSLEILGHFLAAWHITGDQKYYDEYERLYSQQRYGDMIPIKQNYVTITDPALANHSDHELAMLSYATLLRYEPNADRRQRLQKSILDLFEYEKKERNPWQVGVIASGVSEVPLVAEAIQTLKEMPDDWREWDVDNSVRQDAFRGPNDRHGSKQFTEVFPYDEIRTMKWNGNPYTVDDGGGSSVLAPTPYLIAYWKLRYYGVLKTE